MPFASERLMVVIILPRIAGFVGLKLVLLHDELVGDEPDEPAAVGVGAALGLPDAIPRLVGQGDPDRAALASVELVDIAGHAGRHLPRGHRHGVDQGLEDSLPGCPDQPPHLRRSHGLHAGKGSGSRFARAAAAQR